MNAGAAPGVPAGRLSGTALLLDGPIVPTLLRLAWPNVVVMLAQASTGLIETFWVAKLGGNALAGMALVFPGVMLMQMISGGAMGGGISSAIARALGGGRRDDADSLVLHAVAINVGLGILTSILVLAFGAQLYGSLGGSGGSLRAALAYSNVVFAGNVFLWLMNALASAIRGTGNMLVPAVVTCVGTVLLVPLSPAFIFGFGPIPALGIAGGGYALVGFYVVASAVLLFYVCSGRNLARLRWAPLQWRHFRAILIVGAVGAISSIQTNVTVGATTAIVATVAGPAGVAGYGTGARLEYLLVPLVFGLGAPLVALVGTNVGAGRRRRALRIALVGSALAFGMTEAIGIVAALDPRAWLGLFGREPGMLAAGSAYLRAVGPFYGFFGLGLSLYFASQGAGRLFWPLAAGLLRVSLAVGGGWLVLRATGSLSWFFVSLGVGLFAYGTVTAAAVASGAWFRRPSDVRLSPEVDSLHAKRM
jgi:putative MATE family efflux protein